MMLLKVNFSCNQSIYLRFCQFLLFPSPKVSFAIDSSEASFGLSGQNLYSMRSNSFIFGKLFNFENFYYFIAKKNKKQKKFENFKN